MVDLFFLSVSMPHYNTGCTLNNLFQKHLCVICCFVVACLLNKHVLIVLFPGACIDRFLLLA